MYDFLIIGGGIIGLNIAKELKLRDSTLKILLIEKEKEVGEHSSGRNSGVLHAGFYYTANSLKAKFTKDGNIALKKFCKERGLKVNECAKVVVAQDEQEYETLSELKSRGDANGVELHWLTKDELILKYPNIKSYKKALFCPSTATVDPKAVTIEFKKYVVELGIEVILNCKYIKKLNGNNIITTKGNFKAKKIINAAGLYADNIAKDFGFSKDFVIIPFKGIYLKDKNNISNLSTNIYPVPNLANPFLGTHYTLTVDNQAKIGPTAIPAFWRENYKGLDGFCLKEFIQILFYEAKLFIVNAFGFRSLAFSEIKKYNSHYLKRLAKRLTTNMDHKGYNTWSVPGIRAQLMNKKTLELVQDFIVQSDENSIHILNAVSPAFTSSIPFASWIVDNHIST